jgi:phage repressor protein C with HTH and peptisase S24 domain
MYSILRVALAGEKPVNAGVLLEDPQTNRLYIRMRRDWEQFAPEEADVLSAIEDDLAGKATEIGASGLLASIEDSFSNFLLVSAREPVEVEDFERSLGALYRKHVQTNVIEFVTHLPRYSLAVAAGRFLENREVSAEGWEEAPPDLKITPQMFVARIVGRSMEPKIPDGSLCVFRHGVTGSRQGRLVLVERMGAGANDRYTVKRYRSEKRQTEEGWSHARITLEPLNPEFESWDLAAEEDFRVIAEFVRVLD